MLLARHLVILLLLLPLLHSCSGMVCFVCEDIDAGVDEPDEAGSVTNATSGSSRRRREADEATTKKVTLIPACGGAKGKPKEWAIDECGMASTACYKLKGKISVRKPGKSVVHEVLKRGCFYTSEGDKDATAQGVVGECSKVMTGLKGKESEAEICVCDSMVEGKPPCNEGTRTGMTTTTTTPILIAATVFSSIIPLFYSAGL